ICFVFFFQAEDGIRDDLVTGVQTCALPICRSTHESEIHEAEGSGPEYRGHACTGEHHPTRDPPSKTLTRHGSMMPGVFFRFHYRSEERRVGKECRSQWCVMGTKRGMMCT